MTHIRKLAFGRSNPLVLPLLLVLLLAFSLSAFAKGPEGDKKDAKGKGHFGKICDQLNLTPEQTQKLKEIRKAHRETIRPLREKKVAAIKKLREGFKSGATNDVLRAAHTEVGAIQKQMSEARFENALTIRETMSPEQRVKFDALKGDMRTHFKDQIRKLVDDEEEPED